MLRSGRTARKRARPVARRKGGKAKRSVRQRDRQAGVAPGVPDADHSRVLEMIATGAPLSRTLDALIRIIEARHAGIRGSILLLDDDGVHLRHGAAPSLPPAYCEAIDGAAIGPSAGSCGTAAYRGEAVTVTDIDSDPLWSDYRPLAARHGLRACWSTPIFDDAQRVLGTFAMYQSKPGGPTDRHLRTIELVTHTAAIAIVKARDDRDRARLVRVLDERVKELTVLHEMARLMQADVSKGRELLARAVELLPASWQHSQVCEARITYGPVEAKSPGWRDSPWKQVAGFATSDGQSGAIEIVYLEERPPADEGPFLNEERDVIDSLADMLSAHFERLRAESALSESEAVFRSLYENAAIGITVTGMDERIVRCNRAFTELLGYTEDELREKTFSEITHPDDRGENRDLYDALRSGRIDHFELQKRYLRKNGEVMWGHLIVSLVPLGKDAQRYTIGMVEDITARREAEERIRHLAFHDHLTGLPNRTSLQARLGQAIDAAPGSGRVLALMLLDLSDFRDINNALGHRNGDEFLRRMASSLREALRESDLVASLGADEFAILLARLATREDIRLVMDKISEALKRPVSIAGIPVNVEASVGIAFHPDHGDSVELLWQHADVALRTAKEKQQGAVVYSPEIDKYDPQHLALLGELAGAIDRSELLLHYQPKIDLRSDRTVAVEALVRWLHPGHGLIYPDRFVTNAERTQLINPLTTWVLGNAMRQGRQWDASGVPLALSVNLSARNLHNPDLVTEILDLARSSRFPLDRLTAEITESAIMGDPALAKRVLTRLHDAGIHLSMDDFGIGQSSLSYLKDLPISKMKIDKSFVMGLRDSRNAALVRSAIELGHNLGLQVTAEGVEDEESFRQLQGMGCDIGQGYFFSRPMPSDKVMSFLTQSRWKYGA